jgi:hypothetical protein
MEISSKTSTPMIEKKKEAKNLFTIVHLFQEISSKY